MSLFQIVLLAFAFLLAMLGGSFITFAYLIVNALIDG